MGCPAYTAVMAATQASGWSAFHRSRLCRAAAGLAIVTLLACALPAASGAAGNSTKGDIDYDDGLPEETVSGPLGLLHPHLVVFGDSISSTRGTSLVVRQALRLKTGVRNVAPAFAASPRMLFEWSQCTGKTRFPLHMPQEDRCLVFSGPLGLHPRLGMCVWQ